VKIGIGANSFLFIIFGLKYLLFVIMLKVVLRKYLLIVFVVIITSMTVLGQVKDVKNPWFTKKDKLIGKKVYWELFGGLTYPKMIYSFTVYDQNKRKSLFLPDVGLASRFQMRKWFSLNPRLSYSPQGVAFPGSNDYKLTLNYLKFSLPVDFQFMIGKRNQIGTSKFFLFAGPYVSLPLSEKLSTGEFSYSIKMGDMNIPDYGVNAGFGLRIPTFSLESSSYITLRLEYDRGFSDTYSANESSVAPVLDERLYLNGGKRYNSAFKLIVGIEIPHKNKKMISFTAGGDGKKNYKKVVIIDEK
jgi:hypothetical protein